MATWFELLGLGQRRLQVAHDCAVAGLIRTLTRLLRRDVFYVAVSSGPLHPLGAFLEMHPNVWVFTSKADPADSDPKALYGHVPVPHILSSQPAGFTAVGDRIGPSGRPKAVSLIGRQWTHTVRQAAHKLLLDAYGGNYSHGYYHATRDVCVDASVSGGQSPCWRTEMLAAELAMCPRGTAPVSYRLYEALQMGTIPVYLWAHSLAWLPYCGSTADVRALGFVVSDAELETFIEGRMPSLLANASELRHMRARILAHGASHFDPDGVVSQIHQYLHNPLRGSDLKCWDPNHCALPTRASDESRPPLSPSQLPPSLPLPLQQPQPSPSPSPPPASPPPSPSSSPPSSSPPSASSPLPPACSRGCSKAWASLDAYADSTAKATRLLVARVPPATSSGVSDHVTGLVSAFALALATRRRFRIDWPTARGAFTSRLGDNVFLSEKERQTLGATIATSRDDIQLQDWLGAPMPEEERQRLVLYNKGLNTTYNMATVIVQWRQGLLLRALSAASWPFGKAIKSLGGLSKRNAFGCLYRYLFTAPRGLSESHAAAFARLLGARAAGTTIIGVHIRTGDDENVLLAPPVGKAEGLRSTVKVLASGHVQKNLGTNAQAPQRLDAPLYDGYTKEPSTATNRAILDCAAALELALRARGQVEHRDGDAGDAGDGSTSAADGSIYSPPSSLWLVATDSAALRTELVTTGAYTQQDRTLLMLQGSISLHSSSWIHWKIQRGLSVTAHEKPADLPAVTDFERTHGGPLRQAGREALHEQWLLAEAEAHVIGVYTGFGKIAHAASHSRGTFGEHANGPSVRGAVEHDELRRKLIIVPPDGQCTETTIELFGERPAGL